MMETSPIAVPPLLIRNILTSLFIHADKSLLHLSEKSKTLQLLRCLLVSAFLFPLRLFPSLFPSLNPSDSAFKPPKSNNYPSPSAGGGNGGAGGNTGIARALSQLLSIVNDIPVSSRKYEVVRTLAERLIDENLSEGNEALREVNCSVLSAAFSRTLSQLQAAMVDRNRTAGSGGDTVEGLGDGVEYRKVGRVLRAVRYYGDAAWTRLRKATAEPRLSGYSAEKLAAEVLWLAQKMEASGCVEEAVGKWASASHLAWLGLSAEPRLQGSLVKVSAFLFKQARDLGRAKEDNEDVLQKEQQRQNKMKLLMSWLPLLCRASNGTDEPVLSMNQRSELEKVLEETIETLGLEEEQEQVLSLWLHHFTHCPSSDWPNLCACYARWCNTSRKLLLLQRRTTTCGL